MRWKVNSLGFHIAHEILNVAVEVFELFVALKVSVQRAVKIDPI